MIEGGAYGEAEMQTTGKKKGDVGLPDTSGYTNIVEGGNTYIVKMPRNPILGGESDGEKYIVQQSMLVRGG